MGQQSDPVISQSWYLLTFRRFFIIWWYSSSCPTRSLFCLPLAIAFSLPSQAAVFGASCPGTTAGVSVTGSTAALSAVCSIAALSAAGSIVGLLVSRAPSPTISGLSSSLLSSPTKLAGCEANTTPDNVGAHGATVKATTAAAGPCLNRFKVDLPFDIIPKTTLAVSPQNTTLVAAIPVVKGPDSQHLA